MRREFTRGPEHPQGASPIAQVFGITEIKWPIPDAAVQSPLNHGDWVNRIMVFGDRRLRDRILHLLMAHGAEDDSAVFAEVPDHAQANDGAPASEAAPTEAAEEEVVAGAVETL